jgi:hypothetical protein
MDQPRRYVFTGNASGLGFRFRRPADAALPVQAASSLPVVGGTSEQRVGPGRLAKPGSTVDYLTFKSASTTAKGDYADPKRALTMTHWEQPSDGGPTFTNVNAEVTGLAVLGRLEIDRAVMSMQGQSSDYPAEPPIMCDGIALEGVRIDGYPLNITLAEEFYCANSTWGKLSSACASGAEPQLFMPAGRSPAHGFGNGGGMVKCTMVSSITWADKPNPHVTIEGHSIVIADFGRVFFGEAYITPCSRRVTMVRFELGSPDGGDGSAAAGDTNGNPWPPPP